MSVRTKVLAAANLAPVVAILYTCPAGRTAIVKGVVVQKAAAGAVTATLSMLRAGNATTVLITPLGIGPAAPNFAVYWAMAPGDQLRGVVDGGAAGVWVTGVELEGVAP